MSGPELRVRSLPDFADDFSELADSEDGTRVIVADVAPTMPAEDLRERLDFEHAFVVSTEAPAPTVETVDDGHCARYADFQYPDFAFANDLADSNPLEDSDGQFAGTLLFPEEHVDDSHHRVLDLETFHLQFREVIDSFDKPQEYAAMTGHFNPEGGEWSILSEGAYYRIQSLAFPKGANPDGDASMLREAGMAFAGLIILPREVLSDDVRQLISGKKTEVVK